MTENIDANFDYEYEQVYKPFDFINKDLDLLFLLILIENFKSGKNEFNFSDYFKGDYWDIDEVADEVMDTNDYYSIPDMVISQLEFILEDTRMGEVLEAGIDDIDSAIEDLLIEVAKIGEKDAKKEAPHFSGLFEKLFSFSSHRKLNISANIEGWQEKWKDKSIFIAKKNRYFKELQEAIIYLPSHIILRIRFNAEITKKIEEEIAEYLITFSQDGHLTELPRYQEERLYFAQQIENFYQYTKQLNLIGDTINLPFAILQEKGFEAVKILRFLQSKHVIEMRWSDKGSWKIRFTKTPITPESLLGNGAQETQDSLGLKAGLDYDAITSTLTIGEYVLKIKGPDQKDLLRILFKDSDKINK